MFEKIDELDSFDKDEILRNIETAQKQSKNHSTNNVVKNLIDIFKKSKIFETKLEDNNWWRWIYVKNLKKK